MQNVWNVVSIIRVAFWIGPWILIIVLQTCTLKLKQLVRYVFLKVSKDWQTYALDNIDLVPDGVDHMLHDMFTFVYLAHTPPVNIWTSLRWSWPPTEPTRWTQPCCVPVVWTERLSSPCLTAGRNVSFSPPSPVKWTSLRRWTWRTVSFWVLRSFLCVWQFGKLMFLLEVILCPRHSTDQHIFFTYSKHWFHLCQNDLFKLHFHENCQHYEIKWSSGQSHTFFLQMWYLFWSIFLLLLLLFC